MAVMARIRQQGELSVEEDDGITGLEEILGGRGAPRSGGEVVDEADRLILERDGGAAGSDKHHATLLQEVRLNKGIG